MAISEKKLCELQKRFEKQNQMILNLYKKNGDTSLLEMLYLNSSDPVEVAEQFGISEEIAAKLIEKDQAIKTDSVGSMNSMTHNINKAWSKMLGKEEEYELYTKAFEIVASTGDENPANLAEKLGISEEAAEGLIQKMREKGDIGCDDEYEDLEESDENEDETDDSNDDRFHIDGDLFKSPEKIIEGLGFLGEVIQEVSEKICDVLDESVERVMDYDFDD